MPQQGPKVYRERSKIAQRTSNNDRTTTNKDDQPTTTTSNATTLTFYPAYAYSLSPTWFSWVKLTCHSIHHDLHRPPLTNANFTTTTTSHTYHDPNHPPLILFHLNHPIQFVQVVGVVVSIEEYFEKFWLFTVDDSSGATLDVTCRKPVALNKNEQQNGHTNHSHEDETSADSDESARILVVSQLRLGSVVQCKGTLTTFRSTRQLNLLRITLVQSTSHELRLIQARTQMYETVLSTPWVVSASQQRKMLKDARGESEKESKGVQRPRERERKRKEREERHRRIIEEGWEMEERTRTKEGDKIKAIGKGMNS